jgi:hypothetical protein
MTPWQIDIYQPPWKCVRIHNTPLFQKYYEVEESRRGMLKAGLDQNILGDNNGLERVG